DLAAQAAREARPRGAAQPASLRAAREEAHVPLRDLAYRLGVRHQSLRPCSPLPAHAGPRVPVGPPDRAIDLRRKLAPRRFRPDVSRPGFWFQLLGVGLWFLSVLFQVGQFRRRRAPDRGLARTRASTRAASRRGRVTYA